MVWNQGHQGIWFCWIPRDSLKAPSPNPPLDRVKFPREPWPFFGVFHRGWMWILCQHNKCTSQVRNAPMRLAMLFHGMPGGPSVTVRIAWQVPSLMAWKGEENTFRIFCSNFFEENMAGEYTAKHISNWRMWILIIIQFVGVIRYNLPDCLLATVITLLPAMGHWSRWGFPSHTSDLGVETEMLWFQGSKLLDPSSLIVDPSFLDEYGWFSYIFTMNLWMTCLFKGRFEKKILAAYLEKLMTSMFS